MVFALSLLLEVFLLRLNKKYKNKHVSRMVCQVDSVQNKIIHFFVKIANISLDMNAEQ